MTNVFPIIARLARVIVPDEPHHVTNAAIAAHELAPRGASDGLAVNTRAHLGLDAPAPMGNSQALFE